MSPVQATHSTFILRLIMKRHDRLVINSMIGMSEVRTCGCVPSAWPFIAMGPLRS